MVRGAAKAGATAEVARAGATEAVAMEEEMVGVVKVAVTCTREREIRTVAFLSALFSC